METLEFIVYPDGRVQELVRGVAGPSCTEVTAQIEAQLGHVLRSEPTPESFRCPQTVPLRQSVSEW